MKQTPAGTNICRHSFPERSFDRVMVRQSVLRTALVQHSAVLCIERKLEEDERAGKRHFPPLLPSPQEPLKPLFFPQSSLFRNRNAFCRASLFPLVPLSGEVRHLAPTLHLITHLSVGREGLFYPLSLSKHLDVLVMETTASSAQSSPFARHTNWLSSSVQFLFSAA